jgi:HemY protein
MKLLVAIVAALVLGSALIWAANFEPGFVLLQYGSWSLETSLIVFSFAMMVLLLVAYFSLRSLVILKQTPQRISAWTEAKRHKRAGQALTRGLITLEEGRWAEAERILIRHAGNSDTPLLHYLAAARAAQKQGASDRRDSYLSLAHETTEGSDIAVGVVQAELQLAADQKEQALATLQHLREMSPKHPYVLQLLQQLYSDMEQWQEVQNVLPDLRKRHVLETAEVKTLANDTTVKQLQTALVRQDWPQMAALWQKTSNKMRQDAAFLSPYVSGQIHQGEFIQAISLIEAFMAKNWNDDLVYQYGLIEQGDLLKRLATAESWLRNNEDNALLLLTLGRLAQANRLWVKAEDYLRSSLDRGARGETHQVLAEVLAAEKKTELAAQQYKSGLDLMLAQANSSD